MCGRNFLRRMLDGISQRIYASMKVSFALSQPLRKSQLTDEEDGKDNVIFILVKAEIILKTESAGVGDIDTIDKGEEVEDTETWHDVPVYPAQKSSLCGVGWALDEDGLAVAGVGGGVWLLNWNGAFLIGLWMLLGCSNFW